jgi:D-glycero-D-manno-heptose 1,7-bisphosphate phosphatase
MRNPAMIILDRDGVLNELWHEPDLGLVDSPARAEQVRLTPHAIDAVRRINAAKLPCVVASNQPGPAKGKLSAERLREVTRALLAQLSAGGAWIDRVYYCLHHPEAVVPALRQDCDNRKPRPGLLLGAAGEFGVAPEDCWFIGDTATDMKAGAAAGCRTAWIGAIRCDQCPTRQEIEPDLVAPDLLTAVATILDGASDVAVSG